MAQGASPLMPGQFGPVFTGGRRRRHGHLNGRSVLTATLVFMLVILLSATATGAALLWYGEWQLQRVDVPGLAMPGDIDNDGDVDIQEIADVRNVLVVGSDSREGLTARERERLGVGQFEGSRTDTIFIVQLDPNRDSAAMLAFPRDLLVTLCDGSEGRINGAYEVGEQTKIGGPSCLVKTINDLTGIPIHHYVQVDFAGFVGFVDQLGGVRMYLEEPIQDEDAHVNLEAGCQVLNGREALGFVRVRKIDSDFGRIARQQRFIREVVDQLTSARIALDVPRLFRLVNAAAKAVKTDESLSLNVMRRIAFSFRELSSDRIDARTVPAYNREINGAAYVVADEGPAKELFAAFARGEAAPRELGTDGPADVKIADVPPLIVHNGTRRAGLAGTVSTNLQVLGFEIAVTDNAPQPARKTFVEHPPRRAEEASLVAKAMGGARLRQKAGAADLRLVLGNDADIPALIAAAEKRASSEQASPTPEAPPEPDYAGASSEDRDC